MKTLESCSPSWQRRRFIYPRCKLYSWPHGAKCILTGVILGIWSWSHSTNHTARHKDCCCFAPVIGGCEPTNGPRRRRPVSSFPASVIVFSLTFLSPRRYGGEEASKIMFHPSSIMPLLKHGPRPLNVLASGAPVLAGIPRYEGYERALALKELWPPPWLATVPLLAETAVLQRIESSR